MALLAASTWALFRSTSLLLRADADAFEFESVVELAFREVVSLELSLRLLVVPRPPKEDVRTASSVLVDAFDVTDAPTGS